MRGCSLLLASLVAAHASRAQTPDARIRAQRDTLERIRREREELERRDGELQGNVHDLNEEVANLDRRADATARVIKTLDRSSRRSRTRSTETTDRMASAESELVARSTTLQRRLVDIYKRGPLYSAEALLSARSFGELVARYKYLHLLALHDRSLVTASSSCATTSSGSAADLVKLRDAVEENRTDKQREEERLVAR